jgi:peptidoglycan/xylan/chitin deacetylase (PgdA/CDA1 family)
MAPLLSTILPNSETVRARTAWICGLFHAAGLGRRLLERQRSRGRIPILLYHSIGEAAETGAPASCFMAMGMVVEEERFEAQMDYLFHNTAVVGLDEAAENLRGGKPLPGNAVVLTFDDGFRDNVTLAAPILRRHGFRAAFFPIGSLIRGSGSPWPHGVYRLLDALQSRPFLIDIPGFPPTSGKFLGVSEKLRLARRLRPFLESLPARDRDAAIAKLCLANGLPADTPRCGGLFMTEADLHLLAAEGHIIGGHSMSHRSLTGLAEAECVDELRMSGELVGGRRTPHFASFAYPYGRHNDAVRHLVRHSGFDCAVTTAEGLNGVGDDLFALRRIYVGNFGIAEFETHLSGAAAPLLRLARGCY